MTHPAIAINQPFMPNPITIARLAGGIAALKPDLQPNPHPKTDARHYAWEHGKRETLHGWKR